MSNEISLAVKELKENFRFTKGKVEKISLDRFVQVIEKIIELGGNFRGYST